MDMLNAMRTFQQVALSGGFTSAAKQQGRAVSSVSRQISLLEEELGKQFKRLMPFFPVAQYVDDNLVDQR